MVSSMTPLGPWITTGRSIQAIVSQNWYQRGRKSRTYARIVPAIIGGGAPVLAGSYNWLLKMLVDLYFILILPTSKSKTPLI